MTAWISRICSLDTLVADGKEAVHARDAVEFIYYDSEATAQMVAVDTCDRLSLYTWYPEEGAGRNLLSILHQNLVVLVVGYHLAKLHIHTHAGKEFVCFLRRFLWHSGEQSVASFQEIDVHQRWVHIRIIIRNHVALHFWEGSGNLHTCGTTAHNDHVQEFLALLFCGTGQCTLQVTQHSVAQSHCLWNGLHRNRPLLDVGIAIEIGSGSCCEHQVIVLNLTDGSLQNLLVWEYGSRFCHAEVEVLALAENLAEREGDGTWVDTCRSYLIDKRRELMEIVLIDQHHLQVWIAEVFCQTKTTESATYDNYSLQLISLDINAHNYCCFYILITYICWKFCSL